jgi:hypothetical protein
VLEDWEWGEGQNLGLQMGPAPDNICHSIPPSSACSRRKNGLFTVRSAYHMAKMRELQEQAESSSSWRSLVSHLKPRGGDYFHILWDCPSARDVRSGSLKKFQKSSSWGPTFRQAVIEVIQGCDDEAISLFVGIARRIWFRRNEVIHGGLFSHPNVLVQRAREDVEDFAAANKISLETNINFEEPNGESGGCSRMVVLTTI